MACATILQLSRTEMANSYQELQVWQRAMELSLSIYQMTEVFPGNERFGLTSQLRRAGVSIPSNIAEGYGRNSRNDYRQFLAIARGSTFEVQTQLILAKQLGYCIPDAFGKAMSLSEEVSKCFTRY